MKFSIFSFLLLSLFAFSSCEKGDFKDDKYDDKEYKDDDYKDDYNWDEEDKAECFVLAYPVTYTMPDGTAITGNNKDELWSAIKDWYEAHPDSKAKPVLQYPVDIAYEDGTTATISNEEAMELAKKDCGKDDEVGGCSWDGSVVADPDVWEEHIIKPLVTDDACGGCTVSGQVKYVKIDTDFAYEVYYGKGECDEWAWLVKYYGDDEKKVSKCKFKLDCDPGGN